MIILSKSHIKSNLLLKNQPIGYDEYTIFYLEPLNSDLITNEGYTPVNNISTFRKFDGKIRNGIAIEEATTNLIQNPSAAIDLTYWFLNKDTNSTASMLRIPNDGVSTNTCIECTRTTNVSWIVFQNRLYQYLSSPYFDTSKQYTLSLYAKSIYGDNRVNISIRDSNYSNIVLNYNTINLSNIWKRFSITFTPLIAGNLPELFITSSVNNSCFRITDIMLEQKPFSTSFTHTSRAAGQLKYNLPANFSSSQGTISFWYYRSYPNSYVTNQQTSPKLIQIGEYYTNSSITIWNINNILSFYVKGNTGSGWSAQYNDSAGPALNDWTHVVLTWNNTTWKFYINGVLKTTQTASTPLGSINGNSIYIGGDGNGIDNKGQVANGILSDIRIDKIERSEEEIFQMYIAGSTLNNINKYGIVW